MKQLIKILKAYKKFLLVAHIDPDGDVVSSVLTLDWLLRKWGKQTVLVAKDPLPGRYQFLPGIERIRSSIPKNFRPEVVVVLDTPSLERTGLCLPAGVEIVNIDHHPSNLLYGTYNWIEEHRSSTSELLYRLIRQSGVRLDPKVAFIIYVGIFAETGGFSYPNTAPETLEAAGRLLRFGFSSDAVSTRLNATSPANLRLLSRVLATLETKNGIASIHLSRRMRRSLAVGAEGLDSDNFIRYPMMVRGVQVAVFLREEKKNLTRVSLRSRGEVNVDLIAQSLGGGGHRTAAGIKIKKPLAVAKREVWKATERFMAGGGC